MIRFGSNIDWNIFKIKKNLVNILSDRRIYGCILLIRLNWFLYKKLILIILKIKRKIEIIV